MDWKLLFIILIILLLNLLFPLNISQEHRDSDGTPFVRGMDSLYIAKMASCDNCYPENNLGLKRIYLGLVRILNTSNWIPVFLSIILALVYYFHSKKITNTLLVSLCPYIFFTSSYGYLDTNAFIFLLFGLCFIFIERGWDWCFYACSLCFYVSWEGARIFLILLWIYYVLKKDSLRWYLFAFVGGIAFFILNLSFFRYLILNLDFLLSVQENGFWALSYQSIPIWIFIAIAYYFMCKEYKYSKIVSGTVLIAISTLGIRFIPFVFIFLANELKLENKTKVVISVLLLYFLVFCFIITYNQPDLDIETNNMVKTLPKGILISWWDYGYAYGYSYKGETYMNGGLQNKDRLERVKGMYCKDTIELNEDEILLFSYRDVDVLPKLCDNIKESNYLKAIRCQDIEGVKYILCNNKYSVMIKE